MRLVRTGRDGGSRTVNAAVLRLTWANWRGRRLVSLLALSAVVAIAAAGIVAGVETQTGAAETWDRAFRESNGSHVMVSADAASVLDDIVRDERVAQASGSYP